MSLAARRVRVDGRPVIFVKMPMAKPWLLVSTTGQWHSKWIKFDKHALLGVLRDHVDRDCNGGLLIADVGAGDDDHVDVALARGEYDAAFVDVSDPSDDDRDPRIEAERDTTSMGHHRTMQQHMCYFVDIRPRPQRQSICSCEHHSSRT